MVANKYSHDEREIATPNCCWAQVSKMSKDCDIFTSTAGNSDPRAIHIRSDRDGLNAHWMTGGFTANNIVQLSPLLRRNLSLREARKRVHLLDSSVLVL